MSKREATAPELKDGLYSVNDGGFDFIEGLKYENWSDIGDDDWDSWQGKKGVESSIEDWRMTYEPSLVLPIEYLT